MPKQREIREKVLLSLFAVDKSKDALTEGDLWDLCFEPEIGQITKLSIKLLKHQLQALPKLNDSLVSIVPTFLPILRSYEEKAAVKDLIKLQKRTHEFHYAFSKISNQSELETVFTLAKNLRNTLSSYKTVLDETTVDHALKAKLEKLIQQLLDITDRAATIAEPMEKSGEKSILPLIKLEKNYQALRSETAQYLENIQSERDILDEQIKKHLQNFSQEQIGKVERNILRLGAFEILIQKLPKGIAINEALELAKKYATDDAVALINGVLDHLEISE